MDHPDDLESGGGSDFDPHGSDSEPQQTEAETTTRKTGGGNKGRNAGMAYNVNWDLYSIIPDRYKADFAKSRNGRFQCPVVDCTQVLSTKEKLAVHLHSVIHQDEFEQRRIEEDRPRGQYQYLDADLEVPEGIPYLILSWPNNPEIPNLRTVVPFAPDSMDILGYLQRGLSRSPKQTRSTDRRPTTVRISATKLGKIIMFLDKRCKQSWHCKGVWTGDIIPFQCTFDQEEKNLLNCEGPAVELEVKFAGLKPVNAIPPAERPARLPAAIPQPKKLIPAKPRVNRPTGPRSAKKVVPSNQATINGDPESEIEPGSDSNSDIELLDYAAPVTRKSAAARQNEDSPANDLPAPIAGPSLFSLCAAARPVFDSAAPIAGLSRFTLQIEQSRRTSMPVAQPRLSNNTSATGKADNSPAALAPLQRPQTPVSAVQANIMENLDANVSGQQQQQSSSSERVAAITIDGNTFLFSQVTNSWTVVPTVPTPDASSAVQQPEDSQSLAQSDNNDNLTALDAEMANDNGNDASVHQAHVFQFINSAGQLQAMRDIPQVDWASFLMKGRQCKCDWKTPNSVFQHNPGAFPCGSCCNIAMCPHELNEMGVNVAIAQAAIHSNCTCGCHSLFFYTKEDGWHLKRHQYDRFARAPGSDVTVSDQAASPAKANGAGRELGPEDILLGMHYGDAYDPRTRTVQNADGTKTSVGPSRADPAPAATATAAVDKNKKAKATSAGSKAKKLGDAQAPKNLSDLKKMVAAKEPQSSQATESEVDSSQPASKAKGSAKTFPFNNANAMVISDDESDYAPLKKSTDKRTSKAKGPAQATQTTLASRPIKKPATRNMKAKQAQAKQTTSDGDTIMGDNADDTVSEYRSSLEPREPVTPARRSTRVAGGLMYDAPHWKGGAGPSAMTGGISRSSSKATTSTTGGSMTMGAFPAPKKGQAAAGSAKGADPKGKITLTVNPSPKMSKGKVKKPDNGSDSEYRP